MTVRVEVTTEGKDDPEQQKIKIKVLLVLCLQRKEPLGLYVGTDWSKSSTGRRVKLVFPLKSTCFNSDAPSLPPNR